MNQNNMIHELNKIRQTKIQVQLQGAFPQCVKLPVNQESLLFFLQSQRARPLKQSSRYPFVLNNDIRKFKLTINQAPPRELVQAFTPLIFQQKQSLFQQKKNYDSHQRYQRSYSPQEIQSNFEGKPRIIPYPTSSLKKPHSLSPLLQRYEKEGQVQKILLKSTKFQQSKKYDLKLPQIRELVSSQSQSIITEKFSGESDISSKNQQNQENISKFKGKRGQTSPNSQKECFKNKQQNIDSSFSMWDQNEYEDLQSLHHLHSREQLVFNNNENSYDKSSSSKGNQNSDSSNFNSNVRLANYDDEVPEYQINLNSLIYGRNSNNME